MAVEPNPSQAAERASTSPPVPATKTVAPDEGGPLTRLRTGADLVIATGVVLAVCYFGKLPLIVLLLSILLAFVLAPIVEVLQRVRVPRPVGALVAVLLLMGFIYLLVYVFYTRAQGFAEEWPRYEGQVRSAIDRVWHTSAASPVPASSQPERIAAGQAVPPWVTFLAGKLGSISEIIFLTSFIPFLIYFMLTWQEHVRSASVMLFDVENRSTAYVTLGLISTMIRDFIVGNLLIGLIVSAISTAVFALVGLQFFYFVGFISGFLSLVPYLGVVLALVPPLVTGIGQIHSTQFVIIVVAVLGLHLFAMNVLYPKFLGARLHLNPLAVTLALVFWEFMWGPMGLILAIPITAALKIICDHVERLRPYGAWLAE